MTKYIDLSHYISPEIPTWPGDQPFMFRSVSSRKKAFLMPQGCGTHIDAPMHFYPAAADIASIAIDQCIVPACVLNVRTKVDEYADYAVTVKDVIEWEGQYGEVPPHCIFIANTGWSRYWDDRQKYLNIDTANIKHFPGFSKEAANYLLSKKIAGIGIDAMSTDPGSSVDFPVHCLVLSQGAFQIENLCNLEQLPPIGTTLIALPIKVKGAEEAPARVVAMIKEA